jgi:hypothetical protein
MFLWPFARFGGFGVGFGGPWGDSGGVWEFWSCRVFVQVRKNVVVDNKMLFLKNMFVGFFENKHFNNFV